jgi:hypothetical protein
MRLQGDQGRHFDSRTTPKVDVVFFLNFKIVLRCRPAEHPKSDALRPVNHPTSDALSTNVTSTCSHSGKEYKV